MSLYFHPLFRFADELEKASRHVGQHSQSVRSFTPKFDVKETKDGYELHGEIPGVEQSNVNIEWSDEHTLSISGHTESRNQASSDNKAEDFEVVEAEQEAGSSNEKYQKPTVEEEGAENNTNGDAPATAVKAPEKQVQAKPQHRYWVSERSFGSFHRTFTFPGRVDQENVKAALKNGVLAITIPKAKPLEPRKISIN